MAQGKYAVLWFKGKELNMVFGLLLSISNVVRHTPLPSPLTPHPSLLTLYPHPSLLTLHPYSSSSILTLHPHPSPSPQLMHTHTTLLSIFSTLPVPSPPHTSTFPIPPHSTRLHTSTLHTSSPYTHLDYTGWHNQHEH